MADIRGIEKPLAFHSETYLTLGNDVPMKSVSRMLGYTQIRTIQISAKVMEAKAGLDMGVLGEKLNIKRRFLEVVDKQTQGCERLF